MKIHRYRNFFFSVILKYILNALRQTLTKNKIDTLLLLDDSNAFRQICVINLFFFFLTKLIQKPRNNLTQSFIEVDLDAPRALP